jgi:hypothetical protein
VSPASFGEGRKTLALERCKCLCKIKGMSEPHKDLENVNDNLPVEHQLELVHKWAKQLGYLVVAAAVEHALIELQKRPK